MQRRAGGTCTAGCEDGGCTLECDQMGDYEFACAGGGCAVACEESATCSITCGGDTPCQVQCADGGMATCTGSNCQTSGC